MNCLSVRIYGAESTIRTGKLFSSDSFEDGRGVLVSKVEEGEGCVDDVEEVGCGGEVEEGVHVFLPV